MSRTLTQSTVSRPARRSAADLFWAEALASFGGTFLIAGIFFYTQHHLGWNLIANLLLAAAQGVVYTAGALLAGRLARIAGRRKGLIGLYLLMALTAAAGMGLRNDTWLILPLLAYTFVLSLSWPMLESLASAGLDAHSLSRRIGAYNLVWSGTGALSIAVEGVLIDRWPVGIFLIAVVAHLLCAVLMWRRVEPAADAATDSAHLSAEPALLAQQTRALWLSRISLPATYVVEYSLMAMMPSLPVMRMFGATAQTLIGSVWMVARWIIFLVMGMTHLWHTRPRLLLAAVAAMGLAFFGVTIRLSPLLGAPSLTADLIGMILWQALLGVAVGIIYYASLYFGMVLSQGSTEHGGYHEALIGLGSILGPGCAAMAAIYWPGRLSAGLAAVGVVIGVSIVAAGVAGVRRFGD